MLQLICSYQLRGKLAKLAQRAPGRRGSQRDGAPELPPAQHGAHSSSCSQETRSFRPRPANSVTPPRFPTDIFATCHARSHRPTTSRPGRSRSPRYQSSGLATLSLNRTYLTGPSPSSVPCTLTCRYVDVLRLRDRFRAREGARSRPRGGGGETEGERRTRWSTCSRSWSCWRARGGGAGAGGGEG